jgi:hypothetical protein
MVELKHCSLGVKQQSISTARKIPHLRHEKDRTFFFDFNEITIDESVVKAELRLFKGKAVQNQDSNYKIYKLNVVLVPTIL